MNVNIYSLFYDLVAFYIVYNISRTDIKDLAASFINTKQTERHFIQYFTRYLIFFYWNWTFEIVSGKSFYDIRYEQIILDQYNYFSFTFIPRQVILNETTCTRLIFWQIVQNTFNSKCPLMIIVLVNLRKLRQC